jgi:hypothetical protein
LRFAAVAGTFEPMTPFVAPLFFVALQAAGSATPASATSASTTPVSTTPQAGPSTTTDPSSSGSVSSGSALSGASSTALPRGEASDNAGEERDLGRLRELEARLAVGVAPTAAEIAAVVEVVERAEAPRARAAAAGVLAWFDPTTATQPLVRATRDGDARVRASAAQALVAIARRLPTEQLPAAVNAAISMLDDTEDEVACVGAELLVALDPPGARQAFEVRGAVASDVRYGCYVRFSGLPVRPVYMPALPTTPTTPTTTSTTPTTPPPTPASPSLPQTNWVFVVSAAGAGMLAGASLPTAVVSARDVLIYDDDRSRLTRQEVSFVTQAGAGFVGAAVLGAGAWGAERMWGRLDDTEAIAFAGASGAGGTLGAGLGLMLGADGGGQALTLSLGTLAGVATGAGVVFGSRVTDDDNALILASSALGTMGGALAAFSAVPVGLETVGAAQRSDFGLGAGLVGAGGLALVAAGFAPFVEVKAPRAAAIAAGGLAGGGLLTAVGFLVVPRDLNVASRIACGMGLFGEVAGATLAGVFLPDAWLVQPATVAVLGHEVMVGAPTLAVFAPLPGERVAPLGATLAGHF